MRSGPQIDDGPCSIPSLCCCSVIVNIDSTMGASLIALDMVLVVSGGGAAGIALGEWGPRATSAPDTKGVVL